MKARRFPTAAETERVAESLRRRPTSPTEISAIAGVRRRYVGKALAALAYQRRAVRFEGQGWAFRRGRLE